MYVNMGYQLKQYMGQMDPFEIKMYSTCHFE